MEQEQNVLNQPFTSKNVLLKYDYMIQHRYIGVKKLYYMYIIMKMSKTTANSINSRHFKIKITGSMSFLRHIGKKNILWYWLKKCENFEAKNKRDLI